MTIFGQILTRCLVHIQFYISYGLHINMLKIKKLKNLTSHNLQYIRTLTPRVQTGRGQPGQ